ncbi:DnaJ domain-containing protein [Sulfurimonas sp.]|uniref:DnaJ domain-containing protein n=1 Tax=Sulfurimonas sp. TaxID=2022749 RepID=UPI0035658E56
MHISLEKNAIVFRIRDDSSNLFPMMHFIKNSFKNVKYLSNLTVVSNTQDELIRKRYLLKWAYKIFYKSNEYKGSINFKQLSKNLSLPIHIINTNNKHIEKTISITIDHINTNNELKIRCNEYHPMIIDTFEKLFKNSISFSMERRIFKIKITTKYELAILKSLLSRKKISGVSVIFITHSLNFSKLHGHEIKSEEEIYKQKLQKSFKVLGITPNSTSKEIKDNYRKMLRQYHPDKVSNKGVETVNLYTKRFQIIQEAYDLVKESLKH